MDEMSIRKHAEWNHKKKFFVGCVDVATSISDRENLPLAREALVYMLNGINERWKIPIAYFLTNGITGIEKAIITKRVLEFATQSTVLLL